MSECVSGIGNLNRRSQAIRAMSKCNVAASPRRAAARLSALAMLLLATACATLPAPLSNERIAAVMDDPARTTADRNNDVRRKPEQMLAFIGVRPGMRVLDLGTGGGYSAELLARAVGPEGHVHAQASEPEMARIKSALADRIARSGLKNFTAHVRRYDDPVPPEVAPGTLDLATFFFSYHDQGEPGLDRARMNRAVFNALKPGGLYVIADHAGRPGTGNSEWNTLHRIEESFLRREVEAAGFRLAGEADFLRNPADPRDKMVFRPTQPNDEFVLKFVKP